MSLAPGARLGPYEILGAIGAGGMGDDRFARFQREAELLANLNHPNIAQIYGFEKFDGATTLAMERW